MRTFVHMYMRACVRMYMRASVRAYMRACMNAYAYSYVRTMYEERVSDRERSALYDQRLDGAWREWSGPHDATESFIGSRSFRS